MWCYIREYAECLYLLGNTIKQTIMTLPEKQITNNE